MFLGEAGNSFPAAWVRSRLSELRHEFEYTVIHAAPAGLYSDTALLGQLSDGVILALEAHRTRRIVARRTGETTGRQCAPAGHGAQSADVSDPRRHLSQAVEVLRELRFR